MERCVSIWTQSRGSIRRRLEDEMDRAEFRQIAMIAAMEGMLASPHTAVTATPKEIALAAIEQADALLEANTVDERVAD